MADPPRARPRPKPRTKVAAGLAVSPLEPSSTSTPPVVVDVEDEDSYFMKNRNRTSNQWVKLNSATQESKSKKTRTADGDSSDDLEIADRPSPRSRKRTKKKAAADESWKRTQAMKRMLSEELSEDDVLDIDATPKGKHSPTEDLKRKRRDRSRSRSITPPPNLSVHQLQTARNVVRQTLPSAPRSPSPFEDYETATYARDELDPELAKIAQTIRSQTSHKTHNTETSDPPIVGGPDVVLMKVKWLPHPLDDAGRSHLWMFKMKRNDTFQDLFESTADLASILSDRLIISHEGKRIFASATPHSLRVWAEADLDACDKVAYDYIQTQRHAPRSPSPKYATHIQSPSDLDSDSAAESDTGGGGGGGEKFKLIFRSAVTTKDISLTVRPTTTCGAIVKAFIKHAKLNVNVTPKKGEDSSGPALVVDGDRLASGDEIGDAELDEGDLVEVVGL